MSKVIKIQNIDINVKLSEKDDDYICLTDIAKRKNIEFPAEVVRNWLKTRFTLDFIGMWEQIHNPHFKLVEFDQLRNDAGSNSFILSPQKWIDATGAIGIISKSGRYGGGTFAHKDIAFEFATWISPEFKLYLIKEFQRLKLNENEKLAIGWNTKRMLTKINYRIHTDAIKKYIIPHKISLSEINNIYASEADVLNKALFGMTAKEWRDSNPKLEGNIRDHADVIQLVCLVNLENLNAEYIRSGLDQKDRLVKLNESAISQIKSLSNNSSIKKIK